MLRHLGQFLCAFDLRLKERQDSSNSVSKNLPYLRHMFILHLHAIAYKLHGVSNHLDLPPEHLPHSELEFRHFYRPQCNHISSAAEPVTTDQFFFTELIRKGVGISMNGHGLVEGGVKNGHLRNGRQKSPHELNTRQVVRVMQRRQAAERTDRLDDVFIDKEGIHEGYAP